MIDFKLTMSQSQQFSKDSLTDYSMRMISVGGLFLSFCCGGPGGGFLSRCRQRWNGSWESVAVEDHTPTTQLCTGGTGSATLGFQPSVSSVEEGSCLRASHLFADVQLHMLCHAAERVAPGDGRDHSSDRLQAQTRHTSHGQRRHWLELISPRGVNITENWVSPTFAVVIDLASQEKKRLEEKQRTARKSLAKFSEDWKTRWKCPACFTADFHVLVIRFLCDDSGEHAFIYSLVCISTEIQYLQYSNYIIIDS